MNKIKFIQTIFILLGYILCNLLYFVVNPSVNYMWQLDIDFSIKNTIFNGLFLILCCWTCMSKNILSTHFFQVIIIGILMPMMIVSNHINSELITIIFASLSVIFSHIIFLWMNGQLKFVQFMESFGNVISYRLFEVCIFLICIFSACYLILISGSSGALSFSDFIYSFIDSNIVYDRREEVTMEGFGAYLMGSLSNVFIPILIAIAFARRKLLYLLPIIAIVYVMFITFALKVSFLSFFLLCYICLFIYLRSSLKNYIVFLFFVLSIGGCYILSLVIPDPALAYAFIDRFFYLPGMLNTLYFDFFSQNMLNNFNGSRLEFITGGSTYSYPMGFIIDAAYFGGGMNANTGYLASMFGELGYFGLFLGSFIVGLLVFFLNILKKKNFLIAYLLSINIAFILINSPLIDMFLSSGIIFVLLITIILKKPDNIFAIQHSKNISNKKILELSNKIILK